LTEEVADSTPLDAEPKPAGPQLTPSSITARPGPAAGAVGIAPAAYSAFATTPPSPALDPNANPYFDAALGALLDAAGGAVNAEAFFRLERRFWALMRVLAKKGLLTSDDFMKELGEEDR
jgi:hypothetical protein